MLEQLKTATFVVGVKQTKKAVKEGAALRVYLAEDAEQRVVRPITDLCAEKQTEIVLVPTMRELGTACGIEVGAAAAAIIK